MKIVIIGLFKEEDPHREALIRDFKGEINHLLKETHQIKVLTNIPKEQLLPEEDVNETQCKWYRWPIDEEESKKFLKKQLSEQELCLVHTSFGGAYTNESSDELGDDIKVLKEVQKETPQIGWIFKSVTSCARSKAPIYPRVAENEANPSGVYLFPCYEEILPASHTYQVREGQCHVVYPSIDITEQLHPHLRGLVEEYALMKAELLAVCVGGLRGNSGIEQVIKLIATTRYITCKSIKLVVWDIEEKTTELSKHYKEELREIGIDYGLSAKSDLVFVSDYKEQKPFKQGNLQELLYLSDLYIEASLCTSTGIHFIEAARAGNFLIVNKEINLLAKLGRMYGAYLMAWDRWGQPIREKVSEGENEPTYYAREAKKINDQLETNPIVRARGLTRQYFNRDWVYENQIIGLLEEAKNKATQMLSK